MDLIKLSDVHNIIFKKIVDWNYNWWGEKNKQSRDAVECTMAHSINEKRLPQTFVALIDGQPAGMYQLSMCDDLCSRPDIYPWLINVYVDEKYRGSGVCRYMMETVRENAKKAGLNELFLYTNHIGLYEKFGWVYVEDVYTFNEKSPVERLYRMEV